MVGFLEYKGEVNMRWLVFSKIKETQRRYTKKNLASNSNFFAPLFSVLSSILASCNRLNKSGVSKSMPVI
jgi:hypothetical protein